MKNTSRSRESFSVFSAMCIVFLTWTTFSVFVFFSTAAIQPDFVAAHFFVLNRLPAPLCSMGDGVVVAGSLSFQGHFHSLTPGSLSTVQTFTQSLLVRIAMNSMPLYVGMLTSQNFHGSSGFEPKIFERFRAEPFSSGQFFEHARAMLEPAMAR